ncbi:DNA polymerase delta subunit 4 [Brachionus plicatilis]|uniref:DNA polymerase delta subunit 4 n=1 Tax=Brachionus plicatilis TaxID=10195 RepID=A0A3M7RFY5_BRAPC|nr:DNA polymerase delta subunit 4 [Brachionus plicatilis]
MSKKQPHLNRTKSSPHKKDEKNEESIDKDLEILKKFDLDLKFGPCFNVKRIDRWNWAKRHELDPPKVVKEILEKHTEDPKYIMSMWNDPVVLPQTFFKNKPIL